MVDDFLRQLPRIFAALLGEDEGGIGLVIAEPRVGRGRHFTGRREIGRSEGVLEFSS